jgi:Na+-transporting NADH:ubiquinone oxidoreductase subunit F
MALQKYLTTITKIDQLSDHVKLFRLSFSQGKPFHFIAGQFIIISVNDLEGKPQRRSYSIASSPIHTDYIELCIKILPDGRVSGVLDTFEIGSTLEIDGPYGKFVVDDPTKELVFIGTGVGVAPLRAMLFDLFEKGCAAPVWLFFGFRYENDFIFKDDLSALEEQYHNFHFVPVLSRPGENPAPDLDTGHVTDIIPLYVKDPQNKALFICGSLPMVKDVVGILEKIGVTKEQIKTDAWG